MRANCNSHRRIAYGTQIIIYKEKRFYFRIVFSFHHTIHGTSSLPGFRAFCCRCIFRVKLLQKGKADLMKAMAANKRIRKIIENIAALEEDKLKIVEAVLTGFSKSLKS
jgi:hypothetical protein